MLAGLALVGGVLWETLRRRSPPEPPPSPKSLAEIALGHTAQIANVDGPRAFRRRLLEMGLIPGVEVKVVTAEKSRSFCMPVREKSFWPSDWFCDST